jgi:hypothetical protein
MSGQIQSYVNGLNGLTEQMSALANQLDSLNKSPEYMDELDRLRVVKRVVKRAKELEGRLTDWYEELEEELNV